MHIDQITRSVVEAEGRGDTPFGLYIVPGTDPSAELGRCIEREVFYDFFGNSPELLAAEYGAYEASSLFLCIVDHLRMRPAGVFRIVLPSDAGFKTFHDMEKAWGLSVPSLLDRAGMHTDERSYWDVATLAISADYRGDAASGMVRLGLCQALCMLAARTDVPYLVTIIDVLVADLMQRFLQRPWQSFPRVEPKRYLGSGSSLPMYIDAHEYRSRLALIDPDAFALLFMGVGTEAAISTPLADESSAFDERWFEIA
jgi:hypothetical protein